jgi:hypothetical protein
MIETHYALEMAAFLVHLRQPASIRICADDPDVVRAVIRRCGWAAEVVVESPELIPVAEVCPMPANVIHAPGKKTDAVVIPYTRRHYTQAPPADYAVAIAHNAFSYKSLLRPGQIEDNILSMRRWFKQTHQVEQQIGLLAPGFIARWSLAAAAGPRSPALHFGWGQRAMDRIYAAGVGAWLSYVLILAGGRR